jgi:hypothetical protein
VKLSEALPKSHRRGSQRTRRSRGSNEGPDAVKRWTHDLYEKTLNETTTSTNASTNKDSKSEHQNSTDSIFPSSSSVVTSSAHISEQTSVEYPDSKTENMIDASMSVVYE